MSGGAGFAGVQIASALLGGLEGRRQYRAQARVSEENARLSLLEGEQRAAATAREERQMAGAAIAAMAESGAALGTGTALDLIRQSALEREIEIGNVRAQARGEARNYQQQAADARAAGRGALIAGAIGAGAAALEYDSSRKAQAKLDAIRAEEQAYRLAKRPVASILPGDQPPIEMPESPWGFRRDWWTPRPRLRVLSLP